MGEKNSHQTAEYSLRQEVQVRSSVDALKCLQSLSVVCDDNILGYSGFLLLGDSGFTDANFQAPSKQFMF
jgi:hypothetical protein